MPGPPSTSRATRSDALRNRDALLQGARLAFANHGLNAPLEGIARGAGVSIGTLYRHFPTRLDLVQAVFTERLEGLLAAVEEAAELADPWESFALYLEASCALQADDRGLDELAGIRLPHSPCIDELQARIRALGEQIFHRAQQAGSLRADLTFEDLAFVTWSQAGIARATQTLAPRAWRRYLHLILDAFRSEAATPLPEPPLSCDELYETMVHLGSAGPCASKCSGDDG